MSRQQHNKIKTQLASRERGFSLIEAMIAMAVLTVGLVGVAATIGTAVSTTDGSKYANLASTLVSEKIEDLNRWPVTPASVDPHVAPGGSLTADTAGYYDTVSASADSGSFTEVESLAGGGFTETVFNPSNNPVPEPAANPSVAAPVVAVTFDRRWLIEQNPTINGVVLTGARRVTVWIQSVGAIKPPITFQMSMVRP